MSDLHQPRAQGAGAFAVVVEAIISGAHPILMSAITTILGVAPLIVFRDPLLYSMACVVVFGLALGTVLSLLVGSVIYSFFFDVKAPAPSAMPPESPRETPIPATG